MKDDKNKANGNFRIIWGQPPKAMVVAKHHNKVQYL